MDESKFWEELPLPRGLDPLYFNRRRSLISALKAFTSRDFTPIRRVIDVGANIGDTVDDFLNWFPECSVVAFEPLPSVFQRLVQRRYTEWAPRRVYLRRTAISNEVGQKVLYSSNAQSTNSSFAPVNRKSTTKSAHRGLNPNVPSSLELDDDDLILMEVPVTTLDQHFSNTNFPESTWMCDVFVGEGGIDILKIDTQSWDLNVLRGGQKILQNIKVVCLECILDDTYGEPVSLHEIDSFMHREGFRLWDISHIYKDLKNLRTLWLDLVYVNKSIC